MKLIDLSQYIECDMPVYPGDNKVILEHSHVYNRDKYNNHKMEIQMHAGTHIDGPMHMTDVNNYICDLELDSFYGEGCIIHAADQSVIKPKGEHWDLINKKSIVLIHTGMDSCYGKDNYYYAHPILDMSFCEMLVKNNVKMIGIDMPSPDKYPFNVHKYLLSHNVLILENLTNLDKIQTTDGFEVIALPLKIKADSCMVRAVAKIL